MSVKRINDFILKSLDKLVPKETLDKIDSGFGDILPGKQDPNDSSQDDSYGFMYLNNLDKSDFKNILPYTKKNSGRKSNSKKTKVAEDVNGNITADAFNNRRKFSKTKKSSSTIFKEIPSKELKLTEVSDENEFEYQYKKEKNNTSYTSIMPVNDSDEDYYLRIKPDDSLSHSCIKITVAAESGGYDCNLKSAYDENGNLLKIIGNFIIVDKLIKNVESRFKIKLHNTPYKSFKVETYAYRKK